MVKIDEYSSPLTQEIMTAAAHNMLSKKRYRSYIMKSILESAFLKSGDMSSLAGLLLSDFFYISLSISLDNNLEIC